MVTVSVTLNGRDPERRLTLALSAFRTDTDISQRKGSGRERELQQWQPSTDVSPGSALNQGDEDTFGPGTTRGPWDQFAANEKLFGVKTQFDENLYTTKLDRSAADFKEREREAQRIANEIIGVRLALRRTVQLFTVSVGRLERITRISPKRGTSTTSTTAV
jgi:PAB1-binding protein PBP1